MFRHINKLPVSLSRVRSSKLIASSNYLNKSLVLLNLSKRNIVFSPPMYFKLDFKEIWTLLESMYDAVFKKHAKDGYLDKPQCKKALQNAIPWLTEKNCDVILEEVDFPKYTMNEFLKIVNHVISFKNSIDHLIGDEFKKIDKDKDGLLNSNELITMFQKMDGEKDKSVRDLKVQSVMKFDKDKDGRVTLDDFKDWFWKSPENNPFRYFLTTEFLKELPIFKNFINTLENPKQ